ncbi:MAG: tetratricopeptide repeat protein [Desulfobacteraceae bacterium]|nr:tetratricopeptide repeat protein [Desulfobacteraceae bacterium]
MYLYRMLFVCIITTVFIGCSSSPPINRSAKFIRNSTRLLNKGVAKYNKGCFSSALKDFKKAHERYTAADDLPGAANSLNSIANTYFRLEDNKSALAVFDETIELYENLDFTTQEIKARTNKAAVLISNGQFNEAEDILKQIIESPYTQGKNVKLLVLKTQALLAIARKDFDQAEVLLRQALKRAQLQKTEPAIMSAIHYVMAGMLMDTNRAEKAPPHLTKALELDRSAEAYFDMARDLQRLGKCHVLMKEDKLAVFYYKRSAKIFALLQDGPRTKEVVQQMELCATRAEAPIKTTLFWASQWLQGNTEASICR